MSLKSNTSGSYLELPTKCITSVQLYSYYKLWLKIIWHLPANQNWEFFKFRNNSAVSLKLQYCQESWFKYCLRNTCILQKNKHFVANSITFNRTTAISKFVCEVNPLRCFMLSSTRVQLTISKPSWQCWSMRELRVSYRSLLVVRHDSLLSNFLCWSLNCAI